MLMGKQKYTNEQIEAILALRESKPELTRYEIANITATSFQFVKRILGSHPELHLSNEQTQKNAQMGKKIELNYSVAEIRKEHTTSKSIRPTVTLEDCRSLARSHEGECLSQEYTRSIDKYHWKCKYGHEWYSTHNSVKSGKWCAICSGNARKDVSWLHELAKQNNGECLSDFYINNSTLYKWKCEKGDIWETAAQCIADGTWCPYCSGKKIRPEHLKSLAARRNGECLTTEFITAKTHYLWKCKKGHTWTADANHIQQGTWCPHCRATVSSGHKDLIEYIQSLGLIQDKDFIVNDREIIKPKELDIYFPELKFGIEYDGLYYHSEWNPHFISNTRYKKFIACKERDIGLFGIFEDEWDNKKALIQNMIKWRLRKFDGIKKRASDLKVRRLDHNWIYKDFFDKYHIDGHKKSSFAYGLFLDNELLSCMSIARNRNSELEISRFATNYNYLIYGAAATLLKHIKASISEPLFTFSNNRIGDGRVYESNGFRLLNINSPNYWYTDGKVRIDRSRCMRKNDPEILSLFPTEKEQAKNGVFSKEVFGDERPLFRIEDYGHKKWILDLTTPVE